MEPFVVSPIETFIALVAAGAIAGLSQRRRLLDRSGAIAATLLGPALVATGGWWLGSLLIGFFLSSALLPNPAGESPSRTWRQVLANGGPAIGFATIGLAGAQQPLLLAAAATIAATTSDTWATELGRRFGGAPWSLRSRRRVPPGTSGAISVEGTLASACGAVFISALAILLAPLAPVTDLVTLETATIIALGGTIGSAVDSVLGATVQARFACAICGAMSESPADHRPFHTMAHRSGIVWVTNSVVNLLAALAAGIVTMLLAIAAT